MRSYLFILTLLIFACNSETEKNINSDTLELNDIKRDTILTKEKHDFISKVESVYKFQHSTEHEIEDTLILKTSKDYFEITPTGLMTVNNKVKVQLKTELVVENAFLYQDSSFWMVFFEETDYEGSTGIIQKIRKANLKTEYVIEIPAINLGKPIIIDSLGYINAAGFIGQLNLNSGKYYWFSDNLYDYDKGSFVHFDTVIVGKELVEFQSTHLVKKRLDKVTVNKKSGEIIEIIK